MPRPSKRKCSPCCQLSARLRCLSSECESLVRVEKIPSTTHENLKIRSRRPIVPSDAAHESVLHQVHARDRTTPNGRADVRRYRELQRDLSRRRTAGDADPEKELRNIAYDFPALR